MKQVGYVFLKLNCIISRIVFVLFSQISTYQTHTPKHSHTKSHETAGTIQLNVSTGQDRKERQKNNNNNNNNNPYASIVCGLSIMQLWFVIL
jgi:hypothetical protein